MKKVLALVLAMMMCIGLMACGDSPKKAEAISAFNDGNAAFTAMATLMNDNPTLVDDELVTLSQELAAEISKYKDAVTGDELTDEAYDEIIARMAEIKQWAEETKATVEGVIANPIPFKQQQLAKAYNAATTALNEYGTYLQESNAADAVITDFNAKATAVQEVLPLLDANANVSDTTAETWDTLIASVKAAEQWAVDALAAAKK